MSRILNLAVFAFGLVACAPNVAEAAIVVSFDLDPGTPGIQSTSSGFVGDTFDVDVVITLDNLTDSLSTYGFSVRYDTNEFDLLGGIATTRPTGWQPLLGFIPSPVSTTEDTLLADPTVGQYGEIVTIGGESPSDAGFQPTDSLFGVTSFVAATFTLAAVSESDFAIDLVANLSGASDGFLDDDLSSVTPTFQGGSIQVTAVPEPSSIALFAFAAIPVLLRRRRVNR
ncbi:PEP-CTERM sorting domain-containing protein [Planctomycetes bacterium K23_9]|uniref:PEP-CTERM protein-sorting domain-containing protein n=1 Tax=Stieleria marina TaxID=1930275 RepID=A0A517NWD9_9BACT|nr:hypothetical protein K239x_34470 [Planctomycetes bacterium K23_9]